jgi:hypothetical protein
LRAARIVREEFVIRRRAAIGVRLTPARLAQARRIGGRYGVVGS